MRVKLDRDSPGLQTIRLRCTHSWLSFHGAPMQWDLGWGTEPGSSITICLIWTDLPFHVLLTLTAANYLACVLQTPFCISSCFQSICVAKVGHNPFSILHIVHEKVRELVELFWCLKVCPRYGPCIRYENEFIKGVEKLFQLFQWSDSCASLNICLVIVMDLHVTVTCQACLDLYLAMSTVARVEVEWFSSHSWEVYFNVIFL